MAKYEYKQINIGGTIYDKNEIHNLYEKGWRLICVSNGGYLYHLEREIKNK